MCRHVSAVIWRKMSPHCQSSRRVSSGDFHQVEHALGMAAEQGGDVRGADQRAVAYRVPPGRSADQRLDERYILGEPGTQLVQAEVRQIIPRQSALDTQNGTGQNASVAPSMPSSHGTA